MRTYSSGHRQRLAYAISLCLEPDLLLTDEVVAVGDRGFRLRCIEELRRRVDRGLTVVVATHDTGLVQTLCTHALLLREGRVAAYGTPAEVLTRYATADVRPQVPHASDESFVELTFDVDDPPQLVTCMLALAGADGKIVRHAQPEPELIDEAGTYTATLQLPPSRIAAGQYVAKARVFAVDGHQRTTLASSAARIEIADAAPGASRDEAEWAITRLS